MTGKRKSVKDQFLEPDSTRVGLSGCCPRCGQGKLFAGLLRPSDRCLNCGLDFSFVDPGDGPAVFVILIIGFVITGMAVALENLLSPPAWVHLVLWLPVTTFFCLWGLRFSQGGHDFPAIQDCCKEGSLLEDGFDQ